MIETGAVEEPNGTVLGSVKTAAGRQDIFAMWTSFIQTVALSAGGTPVNGGPVVVENSPDQYEFLELVGGL